MKRKKHKKDKKDKMSKHSPPSQRYWDRDWGDWKLYYKTKDSQGLDQIKEFRRILKQKEENEE